MLPDLGAAPRQARTYGDAVRDTVALDAWQREVVRMLYGDDADQVIAFIESMPSRTDAVSPEA